MKTLNFSGRFVPCDLKVCRYRQHGELMKCCEYKRSRSFLDLVQRSFIYKLNAKLNFLSNHLINESQILPWDGGMKVHINGQGHMTKMATMAIN